jgi:hypothetical protein
MLAAMLPDTPAQPMPAHGGAVVARDENEVLAIIRARLHELQITYSTLDEVALLPERYAAKLLCDPPMKHMGAFMLWNVLGTLGFEISLVPHEIPAHIRERLTVREHKPQAVGRKPAVTYRLTHVFLRKIARLGGQARAANASRRKAISEVRRKAALKRWHKPQIDG